MEQPLAGRLSRDRLPQLAIAMPGTAAALVSLVMLVMAARGSHPVWRHQDVNMSEAAALHDAATVIRLIRAGEDPRTPRRIQSGMLFEREVALTPLEAAIAARRPEVVDVLLSEMPGGLDADAWSRAVCLAGAVKAHDVERVLHDHRPGRAAGDARVECTAHALPW
jgi:hypothetical protein